MRLIINSFILSALIFISACGNKNIKQTKAPISNIEELSKKIESNPNQLDLYIQRANLYLNKNDLNNAIVDYQKAISIAPDSVTYYMKLADLFLQQGQIKNTLGVLKKVTDINPNYTDAWIKTGEIYLMFKKYPDVFKFANKALEADPYSDKAFFLKAYAYKENADTNKAIENFQQCLKFNPNNYEANVELGILFMGLKNELAVSYFKNAIALDSTKILAYYDLGLFYQNNDMLNEAMSIYKKINKIDPSFPNSYYNIGYIYLQILNISEESIPFFAKAIEVKPDYYQAHFNLGLAHEKLGDVINAEKNYKDALLINPNYTHAIEALNRVQKKIN
jgi:tetratricopeptide (TPR) repeat protein